MQSDYIFLWGCIPIAANPTGPVATLKPRLKQKTKKTKKQKLVFANEVFLLEGRSSRVRCGSPEVVKVFDDSPQVQHAFKCEAYKANVEVHYRLSYIEGMVCLVETVLYTKNK